LEFRSKNLDGITGCTGFEKSCLEAKSMAKTISGFPIKLGMTVLRQE